MSNEPIHSRGVGRSGPKRKTGCLTCRRRKVRCDERKPTCSNCIRLRLDCLYPMDRKSSRSTSITSASPDQSARPLVHPLPFAQHFNASPGTLVQPNVPATNWTPVQLDQQWRFDSDLPATFATPFQDIFLSSINDFDAACDLPYNGNWNQGIPSVPSEVATEVDSTHQTAATTSSTTEASTEPPYRDEERSRNLVEHFVRPSANPIADILPTDTEWASACRSLLGMAKQCECVLSAICAFSALHLFISAKNDTLQEAYQHYRDASREVDRLLDDPDIPSRMLKGGFATLFLLTRVELLAQTNSDAKAYNWPLHHLQNAHHRVSQHSDQIQLWRGISKRLLTWTTLLQTKAEYNAGITTLENSSEPLGHSTGDPFARVPLAQPKPNASTLQHHNRHADDEDDTRTIPELAYETMNQPGFDFYLKTQAFTSRIISLDQYHRRRGTVEAEFEILNDGQRISADLHALWESRPATTSFLEDPVALEEALQPRLARKLVLQIRVYVATYYAQFIYLHRVAYKTYPATEDVIMAVAKIVTLARSMDEDFKKRQRQQQQQAAAPSSTASSSPALARLKAPVSSIPTTTSSSSAATSQQTPDISNATEHFLETTSTDADAIDAGGLPAAMLWPLFLAAIEGSKEDRTWLLGLMQDMDAQAVPNAARTAQLLEEVLRRQETEQIRIDHRAVRKDLFESELSVLY